MRIKSERGATGIDVAGGLIIFVAASAIIVTMYYQIYMNVAIAKIHEVAIGCVTEIFEQIDLENYDDITDTKVQSLIEQNGEKTVEIVLSNGSKYTYKQSENAIYRGNVKIARTIAKFEADNFEENGKKIIRIKISTGTNKEEPNFGKTIKYVLRYW